MRLITILVFGVLSLKAAANDVTGPGSPPKFTIEGNIPFTAEIQQKASVARADKRLCATFSRNGDPSAFGWSYGLYLTDSTQCLSAGAQIPKSKILILESFDDTSLIMVSRTLRCEVARGYLVYRGSVEPVFSPVWIPTLINVLSSNGMCTLDLSGDVPVVTIP